MEVEKDIWKVMFVFITIAIAIVGDIVSKGTLEGTKLNKIFSTEFIFLFSQIEFFMGMFMLAAIYSILVHAAYIGAIEDRINALAGERIALWTLTASKYLWGIKSVLLWSICIICGTGISVFVYLLFKQPMWIRALCFIELMIFVFFLVCLRNAGKAYQYTKKEFSAGDEE